MGSAVRSASRMAALLTTTVALGCSSHADGTTGGAETGAREPLAVAGSMAVVAAAAPAPPLETGPMAVYLVLENRGSLPDTLLAVSSPAASRGSVHATTTANGMSGMGPAGVLPVEPNGVLRMEPGGLHMMLDGLAGPIHAGDSLEVQLRFSREGELTLTLPVVTYADVQGLLGAMGSAPAGEAGHTDH